MAYMWDRELVGAEVEIPAEVVLDDMLALPCAHHKDYNNSECPPALRSSPVSSSFL